MLKVLEEAGFTTLPCGRKHRLAKCQCSCGNVFVTRKYWAESGRTKSCGCLVSAAVAESNKRRATHGLGTHELYHTWYEMMKRCYSRGSSNFDRYGARGIQVHDPWHQVDAFIAEVTALIGQRPINHELDRIDNNGNYCPGNVKWSTIKEQARNRRTNRNITIGGKTQCLSAWSEETGISKTTLARRLDKGVTGPRLLTPTKVKR